MTLEKLYPMPCPFRIGDIIHDTSFDHIGTVVRIYGEFAEYQIEGTKGAKGLRYTTEKDSKRIGRVENESEIKRMEAEAKIFIKKIRRGNG